MVKIGELLKELRKNRGLTLQEVADQIGCSPSYLHRLESSSRKNPSIQTAAKLAEFYKIEVGRLTGFNQEQVDNVIANIEFKKEINEELDKAISKMKEGLSLINEDVKKSREEFINAQKNLLYIQSLI